jgi:hypothetical protein
VRGSFWGSRTTGASWRRPMSYLDIVRSVRSPWVGINLDSGNFSLGRSVRATLRKCLPFAVNVQVKVEIRRKNAKAEPSDLGLLAADVRRSRGIRVGWLWNMKPRRIPTWRFLVTLVSWAR